MAGRSATQGRSILVRVCITAVLVIANASIPAMATPGSPSGYSLRVRRFSPSPAIANGSLSSSSLDHEAAERTSCNQSKCSPSSCCNGVCVDVFRSAQSCGACNNTCAYNRECCDGVCVDTHASDNRNCGSCGRVCERGVPCLFGMCGYSSGRITIP